MEMIYLFKRKVVQPVRMPKSYETRHDKSVFGASDQFRHIPGCTATCSELRIEEEETVYYLFSENKSSSSVPFLSDMHKAGFIF